MAGPGGREVGRVSIRVLPDTSHFVDELRTTLARIEQTLKVEIPAILDSSGLVGEARAAVREVQAAVGPIKFTGNVNASGLTAEAERAVKTTEASIGPVTARITADTIPLRAEVAALGAELRNKKLEIQIGTNKARATIVALQAEIAKTAATIGVDVNLAAAKAKLIALQQTLSSEKAQLDLDLAPARKAVAQLQAELRRKSLDIQVSSTKAQAKIAGLRAEIAKTQAAIKLDANDKQAKATLRRLQKSLNNTKAKLNLDLTPAREAAAQLKAELARKSLALNVSTTKAQAKIKAIQDEISNTKKTIELDASDAPARAKLAELKRSLDQEKAKLDIDLTPARESVAKLEVELSQKKLELHTEVSEAKAAAEVAAAAKAAERAAPNVKIPIEYDKKSLANLGRSLDKVTKSGGGGGSGLSFRTKLYTAIGVAALAASTNILSLAGSIAQAGGAIALIPAVADAAAIGIGTLAIAFHGFGQALKDSGDPKKYAADLKKLSPAAAGVVKAFVSLKSQASALRASVQQAVFSGLAGEVKNLGNIYLPILSKGLTSVGGHVNEVFKNFAQFAQTKTTIADTGTILGNVSKAFGILAQAVKPILSAFRDLAVVGSTFLPGLAQGITDASTRFAAFIANARQTGQIAGWISGGIAALKALGQFALSAGSAVAGIVRAAQNAGGGTLQALAAGMQNVAAVINGPAFQAGLTSFFAGIQTGFNSLMSALPSFGAALSALGPVLGQIAISVGPLLATGIKALSAAFIALAPVLIPIIAAIGQGLLVAMQTLAPILLQVAQLLAVGLGAAFRFLVPIISAVVSALTSFFASTGGGGQALAAVSAFITTQFIPAFQSIWATIQNLWAVVSPILAQLVAVFMANFPAIKAIVVQVFSTIGSIILSVMTFIQTTIANVTTVIKVLWGVFGGVIMATIRAVFPAILSIIKGVLNVIQGVVRFFTAALKGNWSGAWNAIKQILSGAWQIIVGIVKNAIATVVGIHHAFQAGISAIWNKIKTDASTTWNSLWSSVKSIVAKGIGHVTTFFVELPGKITKALGDLGGLLSKAGSDLVAGFVQSIRNGVGAVGNAAKGLAKSALNAVTGRGGIDSHSPSRKFIVLGRYVTQGFVKGILGSAAQVRQAGVTLSNRIHDAVKSGVAGRALDIFHAQSKRLQSLATQRIKATKNLKAAQDALGKAIKLKSDFAAQVKSNIVAFGDITTVAKGGTSTEIIAGLKARLDAVNAYTRTLAKLKALGLNKVAFQQLLNAGVETGGATAQALLEGGKSAIKQVNVLQASITKAGGNLGTVASKIFYQSGIDAAAGLVRGLTAKTKQLAAAATSLAHQIVAAIKRALKIKSPSKVMVELGEFTARGFADGISSGQRMVDQRMTRLARTPDLSFAGAGAGGAGGRQVIFNGPVGTDPMEIARRIDLRDRETALLSNLAAVAVGG